MIVSLFAFWDSLLFDPTKEHFYNILDTLIILISRIRIELYVLLLLIFWKEVRSSDTMKKFTMLVVYPMICFIILINFLQIYFYYSPNTLRQIASAEVLRFGGMVPICLIFFLSSNKFTIKVFKKIEGNFWLAYTLNIPFLYFLVIVPGYRFL